MSGAARRSIADSELYPAMSCGTPRRANHRSMSRRSGSENSVVVEGPTVIRRRLGGADAPQQATAGMPFSMEVQRVFPEPLS
jgi:hypothetical protein